MIYWLFHTIIFYKDRRYMKHWYASSTPSVLRWCTSVFTKFIAVTLSFWQEAAWVTYLKREERLMSKPLPFTVHFGLQWKEEGESTLHCQASSWKQVMNSYSLNFKLSYKFQWTWKLKFRPNGDYQNTVIFHDSWHTSCMH